MMTYDKKQLRDVKILINDHDYRTLSALARLHGVKIYEELAIAVREHNNQYAEVDTVPLLEPFDWLNLQKVSPYNFSDDVYEITNTVYPQLTREQFEKIQLERQPHREQHMAEPHN